MQKQTYIAHNYPHQLSERTTVIRNRMHTKLLLKKGHKKHMHTQKSTRNTEIHIQQHIVDAHTFTGAYTNTY